MSHLARQAESRWTSERIHAAYLRLLCDIAERALWPKWFRGVVGMAHLLVHEPIQPYDPTVITRYLHPRGRGDGSFRASLACSPEEFKAFEGWCLAHGAFDDHSYDQAERRAKLRAQYVGQPDPVVVAWIRAQPSACANLFGRAAYPAEDGLPPMFGPPLAPAERWTIFSRSGWAPTTTHMTEPPWNPVWDGLW